MPDATMAAMRIAALGVALVALAGCTSGSGHPASPSPPPVVSPSVSEPPTQPPVIDPGAQGVDDITGTGTITLSGGSAPGAGATPADSPRQLSGDSSGHIPVEVGMHAKDGSLFSLAGPAAVGTVDGDHVSVLLMASGVLVDNQQGNTCTVRYSKASESGVAGEASCDAQNGSQRLTVRIGFALR